MLQEEKEMVQFHEKSVQVRIITFYSFIYFLRFKCILWESCVFSSSLNIGCDAAERAESHSGGTNYQMHSDIINASQLMVGEYCSFSKFKGTESRQLESE